MQRGGGISSVIRVDLTEQRPEGGEGKATQVSTRAIPGRRNSKGKESGAKRVVSIMGTARSLCAGAERYMGRVRGDEVRKARGWAEVQAV